MLSAAGKKGTGAPIGVLHSGDKRKNKSLRP